MNSSAQLSATVTQADVDFFFSEPTMPPEQHRRPNGQMSILYLLRREAQDTLIGRVCPENRVTRNNVRHRLFATALVLMSGVDLLGKFAAGSDKEGEVRQRFTTFAQTYMSMSPEEAAALYKVRNSLMHSFGLYDPKEKERVAIALLRRRAHIGEAPVIHDGQYWILKIEAFYERFIDGVVRFNADVVNGTKLQEFQAMFPRYGWTHFIQPTE